MKTFFSILFFSFSTILFSQITVDNTQTAEDLVQLLFNNSGCATISNFQVSGNNSFASFNRNGSTFDFDEGVVLSTGFTNHIPGPNGPLSEDNLGTPNDSDMSAVFSDTYDTTVLEFDFVPQTNYMSFEYIFASEEYQEGDNSTCTYSDVFAFLIKSSTDTDYTNIAVVPNTNIPVQVTSVHPEIPGFCDAQNQEYFGHWNSLSDPSVPINYNGQTSVLKAESTVVIGETYHIKLIIADHKNYRYDSAVFLKAGSFNIGTDLGVNFLRSTRNPLCNNATTTLDCNISSANSYTWYKDDIPYDGVFNPIVGANNQTYNVTSEGIYKVEVDLGSGCISQGEITIEYSAAPTVFDTNLISCNNDLTDISEFDLTNANYDITNNDSNLIIEGYYHLLNNAQFQNSAITNFTTYTNSNQDEEIYVRVENSDGCASFSKITLKVYNNPQIKSDEEVFYCLNTSPNNITIESGLLHGNPSDYSYYWVYNNEIDLPLELNINASEIDVNLAGIYTVEITSSDGCTVSRNIIVTNSNIATIVNYEVSETMYPNRVSIKINVTGEGDYIYAVDDYDFQNSPIFDNLLYGYHIVTVKDKNGCIPNTQKEITILDYPKFFTPENDDINNTWNLNNINSLLHFNTVSDITIFDRYGKIMAVINARGQGWNGYNNGVIALPNDYWFRVNLIDFKGKVTTKQGHFSLVR